MRVFKHRIERVRPDLKQNDRCRHVCSKKRMTKIQDNNREGSTSRDKTEGRDEERKGGCVKETGRRKRKDHSHRAPFRYLILLNRTCSFSMTVETSQNRASIISDRSRQVCLPVLDTEGTSPPVHSSASGQQSLPSWANTSSVREQRQRSLLGLRYSMPIRG